MLFRVLIWDVIVSIVINLSSPVAKLLHHDVASPAHGSYLGKYSIYFHAFLLTLSSKFQIIVPHGEPVTLDSFVAWRERYEAELALERAK